MKTKCFLGVLLVCNIVWVAAPCMAQDISVHEARLMRMAAIDVTQKYIRYMSNVDELEGYPVGAIRRNSKDVYAGNALVYNEFFGDDGAKYISIADYIKRREDQTVLEHKLSDWDFGFPYYEDGRWKIKVGFSEILHRNYVVEKVGKKGKLQMDTLPIELNYHGELEITMERQTTGMSGENVTFTNAKIERITVINPIDNYVLLEYKSEADLKPFADVRRVPNIKVNERESGKYVVFDATVEQILAMNITDSSFFYPQFLEGVSEHRVDYKRVRKDLFGLGFRYAPYGLGNRFDDDLFMANIKNWSQELDFELFYGVQLGSKGRTTGFFNVKVDFNAYKGSFRGAYFRAYDTVDVDGDAYRRKINLVGIDEEVVHLGVSLQPSFEYLYEVLPDRLFFTVEVGGYVEYKFWAANRFKALAAYTGVYGEEYFGVEMSHYYDYEEGKRLTSDDIKNSLGPLNMLDYGVFGSLGVWYSFDKRNLMKFNVGYKHGFNVPFKTDNRHILSYNKDDYNSATQTITDGLKNIYIGVSWAHTINRK